MFENYRYISDTNRDRGATFTCGGFSVAIILVQNSVFMCHSHSRNTYGFHDPCGHAIILIFITMCQLNSYSKSFYENNSNISFESGYDLQLITIKIREDSKSEISTTQVRKGKASYSRFFSSKQDYLHSSLKKIRSERCY